MRFSSAWLLAALFLLQGCAAPAAATSAPELRRSAEAAAADDAIEGKAKQRIAHRHKDAAHVSVIAYNGFALITGSAPDDATRMSIERIVGAIHNVKGIANELVVGAADAAATHEADAEISRNVRLRFERSRRFHADHVRIVTESGVVYLLGLVDRDEADAAAEIASTTKGVQKVVRVFEYLD